VVKAALAVSLTQAARLDIPALQGSRGEMAVSFSNIDFPLTVFINIEAVKNDCGFFIAPAYIV
jgi:hypothetical protein